MGNLKFDKNTQKFDFGRNLLNIRTKKMLSQDELGLKIGVSGAQIGKYESGENMPRIEKVWKLCEALGVTESELRGLTLYNKHTSESKVSEPEPKFGNKSEAVYILTETMYVPLVNQYAYAGYMSGFSDPEYIEELPKIPFEVDHEGKGNYVCFEMRGNSMRDGSEDSLKPGDILLGREIQRHLWQSKLHIRKYRFVIVHKESGILVKEIVKHDTALNKIIVHSLNTDYEDQELNLDDISQIFNVVKVQRNN